jgi:hypothetical protein
MDGCLASRPTSSAFALFRVLDKRCVVRLFVDIQKILGTSIINLIEPTQNQKMKTSHNNLQCIIYTYIQIDSLLINMASAHITIKIQMQLFVFESTLTGR